MYREEKIINGVLMVRYSPDDNFEALKYAQLTRGLIAARAGIEAAEYRLKMLQYKTGVHESELNEFIAEAEK